LAKPRAWYYHEDKILVLWECFLWEFVRDKSLRADTNMRQLWQSFERWLVRQFPQAERIVTPFDDPLFETPDYQAFLRSLGYECVAKAAFGKPIT
jgi:hypothetical protein